jgi:hypothetical protein
MKIAELYQKAKEKSFLTGIILIDLISFISFVIFPSGLLYSGDVQMIIGCIIGTRFTLKNIHNPKSYGSYGVVVSLTGTILTSISYLVFVLVALFGTLLFNIFTVLIIFELYLVEAIIIGLPLGLIIGGYYSLKYPSYEEESPAEKEFFDSLRQK